MDETGVQQEHKPSRVVAQKGLRYLQAKTSGNQETITVTACVNAASGIVPPHIIVKGKTSRAFHGFTVLILSQQQKVLHGVYQKVAVENRNCQTVVQKGIFA